MAGSPFVIIKNEQGREIPGSTIREAAVFTAVFSRAWKQGFSTLAVFSVKPEQVSKKAKSGEYLAKGAFMIYGKKTYYQPEMNYAVGVYNDRVMGGPLSAVKKHCKAYVEIIQGDDKLSDVAKLVRKRIGGELDDILRALPANSRVKKSKK